MVKSPKRRAGFTLVELAVSVSVSVAMVVALLPALSNARQGSLRSSCLANQMALGVAANTYQSEYGALPGLNTFTYGFGEEVHPVRASGPYYGNFVVKAPMTAPDPTTSSIYVGIGAVTPYLGSNIDGKVFFCPGTAASFKDPSNWYQNYYLDTGTVYGEFGTGTYFYRGGMYSIDKSLDLNSTGWASNWTTYEAPGPDSPSVGGRAMLTCYYWNSFGYGIYRQDNVVHGGGVTNNLWTDGHAATQELADGQTACQIYYDGSAFTKSQYDNYYFSQGPFWWAITDQAADGI